MATHTGKQYIEGLHDDRTIWLRKEKVDILSNPAFAGSLKGMAGYFDWQNKHAADCLVPDPVSGKTMSANLILPKTADDLQRRHKAFDCFSRYSVGMLSRTPDYVNVTLAGFVTRTNIFNAKGNTVFAERLQHFYREVVEKDLSLTHTIIHPVVDKALPDTQASTGSSRSKLSAGTRTA